MENCVSGHHEITSRILGRVGQPPCKVRVEQFDLKSKWGVYAEWLLNYGDERIRDCWRCPDEATAKRVVAEIETEQASWKTV